MKPWNTTESMGIGIRDNDVKIISVTIIWVTSNISHLFSILERHGFLYLIYQCAMRLFQYNILIMQT